MANSESSLPRTTAFGENQTKAVAILVESLKLYVTLSTISIAGLLALYSGSAGSGYTWLLFVSLGLFFLCAGLSIANVNHLVDSVNKNLPDIYHPTARHLNFAAIFSFSAALVFGVVFLILSKPQTSQFNTYPTQGLIIEQNRILISDSFKARVTILRDSVGSIKKIQINE